MDAEAADHFAHSPPITKTNNGLLRDRSIILERGVNFQGISELQTAVEWRISSMCHLSMEFIVHLLFNHKQQRVAVTLKRQSQYHGHTSRDALPVTCSRFGKSSCVCLKINKNREREREKIIDLECCCGQRKVGRYSGNVNLSCAVQTD